MNAPVPPSPNAPLGARLVFGLDSFTYDRRPYAYAEVRHVEFTQHKTRLRGRDGNDKILYESRLRVKVKRDWRRGKWLVIRLVRPIFQIQKTQDETAHAAMVQAAETMQAKTFDVRMDAYMRGFTARKYLEWGNFQICANGDLFRRFALCMNLRDPNVNCLMYPEKLACLRKPKAWLKRMLFSLIKAGETIDLTQDRDCFLYFMRRQVGLWWGNEALRLWRGKAADGSTDQTRSSGPKQEQAGEERRAPPPEPMPMATSVQHLATLGLTKDASWEVVRVTYRTLARQYHPDLMRGRGANAGAIKIGEEKLKAINEAHAWLEDFYRLKPKGR